MSSQEHYEEPGYTENATTQREDRVRSQIATSQMFVSVTVLNSVYGGIILVRTVPIGLGTIPIHSSRSDVHFIWANSATLIIAIQTSCCTHSNSETRYRLLDAIVATLLVGSSARVNTAVLAKQVH